MYLTTIEHEGRNWHVDLRVITTERVPGTLEFTFVQTREDGKDVRHTWEVPTELVDALHLDGHLSEDLLRQQLARASGSMTQSLPPNTAANYD
jgi:hypothetical protein